MDIRRLKNFKYAFRGIAHCVKNERHMRVHISVLTYVLILSTFFKLTAHDYAILILTISAVVSAEMVNTAVERLSDLFSAEYNLMSRIAKDIAAGAVLVCAIASVIVGIMLFWDVNAFKDIFYYFSNHALALNCLILFIILTYIYIMLGPTTIVNRVKIIFANLKRKVFRGN